MRRYPAAAMLTLVAAASLLMGCGSSDDGAEKRPPTTQATIPSPEAGLAAAKKGLNAEIERLEWPEAYVPTVEGLTPNLGDPETFIMSEAFGADLAGDWNLCAWLVEGVDRVEAGASPEQLDGAADKVEARVAGTTTTEEETEYFATMIDGIRTGDPSGANAYIEANGCRPFPQ